MPNHLQGIDNAEIIATVHARKEPMIPATTGLRLTSSSHFAIPTPPEPLPRARDRPLLGPWARDRDRGRRPPYEVYTLDRGKVVRMDEFTERSEALHAAGLRA